ncbi:MAG: UDP-phosphate galactose phosphotransferase [Halobacteriovorax sp.]|nr:UDP-phosphate galactose phosphotransferase [Halobacteriovorax sp.]
MKRVFDFLLALGLLLVLLPLLLLSSLYVIFADGAPSWFWSKRIGKDGNLFWMPKLRSMKKETPQLATHLLRDGSAYLIRGGAFLRKSSLDELPQLWSILIGDMSFVGPRPALYNQDDLMEMRTSHGIEKLKPGLTGWAQINGRDEISLEEKVNLELFYLNNQSFALDLKILWLTFFKVISKNDIAH